MKIKFDPAVFAESYDEAPVQATVTTPVPVVRSKVTVTPAMASAYLAKPAERWDWRDLRDYVVVQILKMHPDLLPARNEAKEYGIFAAFAGRWGELAGPIARFAFDTQPAPGMWLNAPIGLGRFAKASDPCFAQVIVERHLRQS